MIDDDDTDLMLYKRIVNRSDLVDELVQFSYAEKALEYLGQSDSSAKVDVVTLDINMPRMNGFEFLEAVERAHLSVPIIVMLTTSLDPTDRERVQQYANVKDYINKPLTTEHLKGFVHLCQSLS